MLLIVGLAGFMLGVLPVAALSGSGPVAAVIGVAGSFALGAVVAAFGTQLLAVALPRRSLRRSGPRAMGFLTSKRFRVIETGTRAAAGTSVAVALSAFAWTTVSTALHLLQIACSLSLSQ